MRATRWPTPAPAMPPRTAITRPSTTICQISCAALAPSADRTASSRCLAVDRTSSRFATLRQAINSTRPGDDERERSHQGNRLGDRLQWQRPGIGLRHHAGSDATVGVRIFAPEAVEERRHFLLRDVDAYAWRQPSEQLHRPRLAVQVQPALDVWIDHAQVFDRDVAVHLDGEVGAAKTLRHDTGDDGGVAVDANLPADDCRIAAEMLHPERMAQDDGRRRSGTPGKERPELRVDANGRKVVVAHRDVEELRRLAFSRQAAEARHHAEDV